MAVTADQLNTDVRAKLDAALAGGLAASGAEVVDGVTTARRIADKGLGGCETSTCRVAIAEATGARYLMRGTVESMGRSYAVRLEMIDGITGGVVGMREDRCEICTENDVYETASVTASALKAEVWKRGSGGTASGPRQGPGPGQGQGQADDRATTGGIASNLDPASGSQTSNLLSSNPGAPGGEAAPPRWRTLSWVGIGAGAIAIGAGAFLVSIHHDGTCGAQGSDVNCEFRYKTRTGGFALIGAGALAAVIGTTLLVGRF